MKPSVALSSVLLLGACQAGHQAGRVEQSAPAGASADLRPPAPVVVPTETNLHTQKQEPGESRPPEGLSCLAELYGGQVEQEEDGWFLVLSPTARFAFDDRIDKTAEEELARPDLEDTLVHKND